MKIHLFDCTNTWFETPYDDLTWQMIRFSRKIREELVRKGISEDDLKDILDEAIKSAENRLIEKKDGLLPTFSIR